MPKKTTKKRVVRKIPRAKQPSKRKPVRRHVKQSKKKRSKEALAKMLGTRSALRGMIKRKKRVIARTSSYRTTSNTVLHPYIRTMFLALAAGTLGVFGSAIYYIQVAEATKPFLEAAVAQKNAADLIEEGLFAELIGDLESQDEEAPAMKPPPREYLRQEAEKRGYDPELLNRIAYCESRWRMVKNPRSTAYGYFQIVDGTERMTPQYNAGLRKTDPYANIDMALYLYGKYRTIPWFASRHCWSR